MFDRDRCLLASSSLPRIPSACLEHGEAVQGGRSSTVHPSVARVRKLLHSLGPGPYRQQPLPRCGVVLAHFGKHARVNGWLNVDSPPCAVLPLLRTRDQGVPRSRQSRVPAAYRIMRCIPRPQRKENAMALRAVAR